MEKMRKKDNKTNRKVLVLNTLFVLDWLSYRFFD